MKVMKIGGGCLKDKDYLDKIIAIFEAEDETAVPVVSAVYGITDILRGGIKNALYSEKSVPKTIESVKKKHKKLITETISDDRIEEKTLKSIEIRAEKLERLLYGVAYTEEVSDTVRSSILSYGERFSAVLLAGLLTDRRLEAVAMESDKIGMITDDFSGNATAILPEVTKNFQNSVVPVIEDQNIPIITGYFGCTRDGKITTFGTNGTEYSAAVTAHALDADSLIIWKDIDGFMTSDPSLVKNARKIDQLNYYEAAELSYFGAHILHPRTVEPLVEEDIPIYVKNLSKPDMQGSKISSASPTKEEVIKSVTHNKDISVLRIFGAGVGYKPGIISKIGEDLADMGINIYSIITSQTCINLLLDKKDSKKSHRCIEKLAGDVIERVDLKDDIALIAVVGEGILTTKGLAAKVFSSVADEGINVEMVSGGASKVAYYLVVKERDVEKALRAIHAEFFL